MGGAASIRSTPDVKSKRARARLTITALGLAAIATMGAYYASASFSPGASTGGGATGAGHMGLTVGANGGADNRLTIASPVLMPGDTEQRALTLTISNPTSTMSAVTLTTSGDNGPPTVVSDATDGLKVWIARCSVAWTESGTTPNYSYTCGGSQSDVLGTSGSPVAVLQNNAALSNLTLTDGTSNYLRVKLTLPGSAPSSMSDQSSALTFSFAGTQRSGISK